MSGDLPVVVELFDPVHDEPQAQARGANGEELRLLVFIDREELCTRERTRSAHTLAIAPPETTCGKARGGQGERVLRTSAIQKLKLAASFGIGTKLLSRCSTTHGVPARICSTNARHLSISSAFVGTRPAGGEGAAGPGPMSDCPACCSLPGDARGRPPPLRWPRSWEGPGRCPASCEGRTLGIAPGRDEEGSDDAV